MTCEIEFSDIEDGWLYGEVQTDFWKFRVDSDKTLTEVEVKRVTDAMVKAAKAEFAEIAKEEKKKSDR